MKYKLEYPKENKTNPINLNCKETLKFLQDASGAPSPTRAAAKKRAMEKANLKTQKLVSLSTAMESIQAQTEPIDEQEHLPYVSFF